MSPATCDDLAVLVTTVRERALVLAGAAPADLLDPVPPQDLRRAIGDCLPSLIDDLVGDERNVVLTLVRMWTTLETGEIVSKDEAAARVEARLDGPARDVVALARAAYRGEMRDDWAPMREPLDAFVRHARREIEARVRGRRHHRPRGRVGRPERTSNGPGHGSVASSAAVA